MTKIKHEGLHAYRLSPNACNPREVAFSDTWQKQNEILTGRPYGTLQYLLGDGTSFNGVKAITQDEATVAATVIQWLGSNVGMSFLEDALKRCGYKIVKTKI